MNAQVLRWLDFRNGHELSRSRCFNLCLRMFGVEFRVH